MVQKIMPADRIMRHFVYLHENGTRHFKRFNDPGDIKEMCESAWAKFRKAVKSATK
jgi:hypothetical protein